MKDIINASGLLNLTTTGTHGLASIATECARVGLGALTARRKLAHMADATIRFDILQALDIGADFTLQIAFNLDRFEKLTDAIFLIGSEVLALFVDINVCLGENGAGKRTTDTVKVRQGDFDSLIVWDGNTCYTHR